MGAAGGQEDEEERDIELQMSFLQVFRETSDADVVGHRVPSGQDEEHQLRDGAQGQGGDVDEPSEEVILEKFQEPYSTRGLYKLTHDAVLIQSTPKIQLNSKLCFSF